MRRRPEQDIAHLTGLIHRAEAEKLRALIVEEERLRAQLHDLEQRRRDFQTGARDGCPAYRGIGGDMLWQSWLGRNKARLQTELARLLGKKGQLVRQLQRSFGKHDAACRILSAQQQEVTRRGVAQDMRHLNDLAMLRRGNMS